MSLATFELGAVPAAWTRRHLLDLESLSAEEINVILDTAVSFKEATAGCQQKLPLLTGKTIANLFFENSTRTRTSFSLAARRLGGDTIDFSASGSSLSKGETFIDTGRTSRRWASTSSSCGIARPALPNCWPKISACSVDQRRRRLARTSDARPAGHSHDPPANAAGSTGLTVALVGDIAHSRTARSNIWGLKKLGAHVIVCGPSTLVSRRWEELGVEVSLQSRRHPAALRRAEPAAHPVRAAIRRGRSPRFANTRCSTR